MLLQMVYQYNGKRIFKILNKHRILKDGYSCAIFKNHLNCSQQQTFIPFLHYIQRLNLLEYSNIQFLKLCNSMQNCHNYLLLL